MSGLFLDHTDPEAAFAALQTWTGKLDGLGKWVDVVKDGAGLAGYLRVDGSGNSWALGPASSHAGTSIAYTLVGDTMIYSFYLLNTALTIATATNLIYLRLPAGFTAVARYTRGMGSLINGAVQLAGTLQAGSDLNWIIIQKHTAANFSDDSGGSFSVQGQLAFEVTRS